MRKIGKFEISGVLVEDWPDQVRTIMGHCVILYAWYDSERDVYYYGALCEQFDNVDDGGKVPSYDIVVSPDNEVEFRRLPEAPKVPVAWRCPSNVMPDGYIYRTGAERPRGESDWSPLYE